MRRLLLTILVGLVGGGIIHILTVLNLARSVEVDHWTRFATFGPDNHFNVLPRVTPTTSPLPLLDPAFAHALCRFQIGAEPIRIHIAPPDTLWSLALFDRHGINVFHVNDRAGDLKPVDILLMTPRQVVQLRENPPEDLDSLSVVEWHGDPQGAALLRVFAPTPGTRLRFEESLAQASCG